MLVGRASAANDVGWWHVFGRTRGSPGRTTLLFVFGSRAGGTYLGEHEVRPYLVPYSLVRGSGFLGRHIGLHPTWVLGSRFFVF